VTTGLAPDLIEPVIGFRQWRLLDDGLWSLNCDERWRAAVFAARCLVAEHGDEPPPVGGCSCGVYAWYTPPPRGASAATREYVTGAVVLWGAIEAHATGMRAQYCRIVALSLPLFARKREQVVAVARRLGVAAVPHRGLRGVAIQHGAPLPSALRPRTVPGLVLPWSGAPAAPRRRPR
jgi:hypothetical protein